RSGGYQGIAFAIPINVAAQVKEQLVRYGKVERGRIGVAIQEVTQSLAQSFGLDKPQGALVSSVEPGGPADKAGIKPGDVLLGVNGKAVDRSAELPPLVASVEPGSKATFGAWREALPRGDRGRAQARAGRERQARFAGRRGHRQARPRAASGRGGPRGREGLRPRGARRHPARRRRGRGQRQAGQEYRGAALGRGQGKGHGRAAREARRAEHLRADRNQLNENRGQTPIFFTGVRNRAARRTSRAARRTSAAAAARTPAAVRRTGRARSP